MNNKIYKQQLLYYLQQENAAAALMFVMIASMFLMVFARPNDSAILQSKGNKQSLIAKSFAFRVLSAFQRGVNHPEILIGKNGRDGCITDQEWSYLVSLNKNSPENKSYNKEKKNSSNACYKLICGSHNKNDITSATCNFIESFNIQFLNANVNLERFKKSVDIQVNVTVGELPGLKMQRNLVFYHTLNMEVVNWSKFGLVISGNSKNPLVLNGNSLQVHTKAFINMRLNKNNFESIIGNINENKNLNFKKDVFFFNNEKENGSHFDPQYNRMKDVFTRGIRTIELNANHNNFKERFNNFTWTLHKHENNEITKFSNNLSQKNIEITWNRIYSPIHDEGKIGTYSNFHPCNGFNLGFVYLTGNNNLKISLSNQKIKQITPNELAEKKEKQYYFTKEFIQGQINNQINNFRFFSVLCGYVVADKLTISFEENDRDHHFALIGTFHVNRLIIINKGSSSSTLHIFSGIDHEPIIDLDTKRKIKYFCPGQNYCNERAQVNQGLLNYSSSAKSIFFKPEYNINNDEEIVKDSELNTSCKDHHYTKCFEEEKCNSCKNNCKLIRDITNNCKLIRDITNELKEVQLNEEPEEGRRNTPKYITYQS